MRYLKIGLFFLIPVILSSCKLLYPNYLLRDNKDFYYLELKEVEYKKQVILPQDRLSFRLYTRDGFTLVDIFGIGESGGGTNLGNNRTGAGGYLVKEDGYVELPLLGEMHVEGLTRLELEAILEEKLSVWYKDPFVQLQVTNRRAYIFTGVGGASVLSLPYENTKLIEVIALIGGIDANSKSNSIRIIRGDYDNPSIKKINLSTIAGLKEADFIVQPNDLIIIDPRLRPGKVIISELNWIMTLITTLSTAYLLGLSIARR